jgi:hypothetical protein
MAIIFLLTMIHVACIILHMVLELESLEEIIKVSLFTSFVREAVPVSLILVAPSGTAKSTLIRRMQGGFIHPTDSFSSQGLWDIVTRDPKNELHFLAVPDINPSLSRRPATVQLAVANLLSLTFDGTVRVDDGRGAKECRHQPMGFLSGVTPEIYRTQAKKWFALGLRRRIIPIFYQYSFETTARLQTAVTSGKIKSKDGTAITIESVQQRYPAIDNIMALHIQSISEKFSMLLGKNSVSLKDKDKVTRRWYVENVVPISPHLTLRTLAQAHAIVRNSAKIEQQDIDFLMRFISFCDPEFPRQI